MGLTDEQTEQCKGAFDQFAGDDGKIDKGEFKAMLEMLELADKATDDVVAEMMEKADTDGSGKVNFDEFCAMMVDWEMFG
jgi:Ca2+-binding EF-hand superfamily protein